MKTIIYTLIITLLFTIPNTTITAVANNKIICIDAGHQKKGNNTLEPIAPKSGTMKAKVSSGTTGIYTRIPEYIFTLNVALKLQKELKKRGYTVYMTRTKHNVNISNSERAKYCNKNNADLTIRIHADGSTNKNINGIHVLYPSGSITKSINKKSALAASHILKQLIKATGANKANGTGLSPRSDITGFNWSNHPVVLPELGFMSNTAEDKKLAKSSYQHKLAIGIANGIDLYFH